MTTPWHDDDRFWETFGPVMFTAQRWQDSPAEIDQVLALAGPSPGARVLDMCCGPGRHALELARRGFAVTGVDRTAPYLAEARRRAAAELLSIELVEADMRRFVREERFDLALSLFTSFSYFADPEEDRRVLHNFRRSLRLGGALLLELMGKEVLARIFEERDWQRLDDGALMLEQRRVSDDWCWITNRWTLVRDGEVREFEISHRLYSAAELRALLQAVGFGELQCYGALDGRPYDHQAQRLVIVARA
jgi:SAM-dependent methyltransferase